MPIRESRFDDSAPRVARIIAFVLALGAAGTYGATLEALPSLVDALVVPAAIGLGLTIATATLFARRMGAGTVGLLVASWIAVLGSVVWVPLDGRAAPVTSVALVDWLLVNLDWPALLATVVALACVLAAFRLERGHRAGVGIVGAWLAALPVGFEPCVDLRALPPDEPLEPHVRGVRCISNATVAEHSVPRADPPPRPWLASRPVWPPLRLLAVAVAIAWRRWRCGARPVYLATFSVAAMMAGAAAFRATSGA